MAGVDQPSARDLMTGHTAMVQHSYVVFAWTGFKGSNYEKKVPLLWHGDWIQEHGWNNPMHVVFLAGYENLGVDYLRALRKRGYCVTDGTAMFRDAVSAFPAIRTLPVNDQYWYLRWIVLERLTMSADRTSTIIHLDGDVVFLDDPARIADAVAGKTFIMQGCPFLAAIEDREWFASWRRELTGYLADPSGYQEQAGAVQRQPRRDPRASANFVGYDPHELHDQDLMEFLIADERLPQASSRDLFDAPYYWIQNPLFPREWAAEQGVTHSEMFYEKDGRWKIGQKTLAVAHVQTDFLRHVARLRTLHMAGLANVLNSRLQYDTHARVPPASSRQLLRFLDMANWPRRHNRKRLYDYLFRTRSQKAGTRFTRILNATRKP